MGEKSLLIICICFFGIISCDNVGWKRVFDDNPTEFHNIPLTWEFGDYTNVPDWLSGIFVRNGPAQVLYNTYVKKLDSKSHNIDAVIDFYTISYFICNRLHSVRKKDI